MLRLIPFLIVLGCGSGRVAADPLAEPILPAPSASAYVQVPASAPDPFVARATAGHNWDESLSGGAATLALEWGAGAGRLTSWEAREAAWKAGWAWPLLEVRGWSSPQGAPIPEDTAAWLDALPAGESLGLVRARTPERDVWVALRSKPRITLPPIPRQLPIGGTLILPELKGRTLIVATPRGEVVTASLDREQRIPTPIPGEWLFQIRDSAGTAALFPVYVGIMPPEDPVIQAQEPPVDNEALERDFRSLLFEVRGAYGRGPLTEDLLISSAARSMLANRAGGAAEVAEKLGYPKDSLWRVACRARTVESCMDQILWNPEVRPALLLPEGHLGIAAELTAQGVRVIALFATEPGS